jgi:Co/Zn/Cd efflux system component
MYGRLHISAIKVAMLLAAADWADKDGHGSITISLPHWNRALFITERWRKSLHRLEQRVIGSAEDISLDTIQNKEDANAYRVLLFIADKDGSIAKHSDVKRKFHRFNLDQIIQKLVNANLIEQVTIQSGSKRKRTATAYRFKVYTPEQT